MSPRGSPVEANRSPVYLRAPVTVTPFSGSVSRGRAGGSLRRTTETTKGDTMSIDTLMGKKPNRIERMVGIVEERLAALDEAKRAEMTKALTLTHEEHFAFQTAQSHAHAGGKLTLDEAQAVYAALGGEQYASTADGWPESTTLAMRITVTKLMGELLRH